MHRSARTAQTIRPSRSGSSTMQPATGHAAWQIEQANAPKHRSGSMTAIVFGAFLRGPDIIFVHIVGIIADALVLPLVPPKLAERRRPISGRADCRPAARRLPASGPTEWRS